MPDGPAATLDGLTGGRCRRCRLATFPFRPVCRRCGQLADEVQLSPHGSVEASTTVRVAAAGFQPPYRIGYVKLDDGPRVLTLFASDAAEWVGRATRVTIEQSATDGLLRAVPVRA